MHSSSAAGESLADRIETCTQTCAQNGAYSAVEGVAKTTALGLLRGCGRGGGRGSERRAVADGLRTRVATLSRLRLGSSGAMRLQALAKTRGAFTTSTCMHALDAARDQAAVQGLWEANRAGRRQAPCRHPPERTCAYITSNTALV